MYDIYDGVVIIDGESSHCELIELCYTCESCMSGCIATGLLCQFIMMCSLSVLPAVCFGAIRR